MSIDRQEKRPRYQTVLQSLRQQIRDGNLPPGFKLPALRQLADQFGVSTNTIRSAIRILEREGYLYHIQDIGAFVQPADPRSNNSRPITIAFLTVDIGGGFEIGIARGIEQACQGRGWGMQIYDAQIEPSLELRNLTRLRESGISGVIILPTGDPSNLDVLMKLKLSDYPMVLVDRAIPGLKVDIVESDHERGAYLATKHLLEHGHKDVVMLTEKPSVSSIAARIAGFERAMMDYGLEATKDSKIYIDFESAKRGVLQGRRWLGGFEAIWPVLKRSKRPGAIFAHNDFTLWGAFEACRGLRLRIPEDVSIVGFDDSEITRAMTPPMTTIAQRALEIGKASLGLLERRINAGNQGSAPEHVLVDVDLVVRESVATAQPRMTSLIS